MESKIKIRLGQIEIEYEGSEKFLQKELPKLLEAIITLYGTSGAGMQDLAIGEGGGNIGVDGAGGTGKSIEATTNTIAKKLGVKSGRELLFAAAAQLTFVQEKTKFTRQEMQKEAREANQYYKKSFANNYSNYISQLVNGEWIVEVSTNKYSIPAAKKDEVEAKIV